MFKTVMACLFFGATSVGIIVGAYLSKRADIWIVSAVMVMALWALYDMDWRVK